MRSLREKHRDNMEIPVEDLIESLEYAAEFLAPCLPTDRLILILRHLKSGWTVCPKDMIGLYQAVAKLEGSLTVEDAQDGKLQIQYSPNDLLMIYTPIKR